MGTDLDDHLRLFTRDGIRSDAQMWALKKAGLIVHAFGFWQLTEKGKAEAVRLGFL